MSERKQAYNVMVTEKYVGKDRVERTNYYQVGTAWETNNGDGLSIKLAPGVSVSGELLVLPRKARSEGQTAGAAGADEDEIPF